MSNLIRLSTPQMHSIGGSIDSLFPDIVRQLFVPDQKVKRLAHICLKLMADKHPDVVLLCINALQHDSMAMDPLTRGVSLRTTCLIRHKEVAAEALQVLQKGSVDSSVYVRKCAALSILNLFLRSPARIITESDEMLVIFERLLGDSEPTVLSTTLMSLCLILREHESLREAGLALVHPFFLRIVRSLHELDWIGQTFGIKLLSEYCERNFALHSSNEHFREFIDKVRLVIRFSSSSCVVETGSRVLRELGEGVSIQGPDYDISLANRYLQTSSGLEHTVLDNCGGRRLIKPFLVNCSGDSIFTKNAKIDILAKSVSSRNGAFLLAEAVQYIRSTDHTESEQGAIFVKRCIGLMVQIGRQFSENHSLYESCLKALVGMIDSHSPSVSNEAVMAVRSLIQATGAATMPKEAVMRKACIYISSIIETISSSSARASAIWLINLCHDTVPIIAPNVLRTLARDLEEQDSGVKLELALLAVKVLGFHETNACNANHSSVPQQISGQLVPLLSELVAYILAIGSKDSLVGGLVQAVSSRRFAVKIDERVRSLPKVESEIVEGVSKRVNVDTDDMLRKPKTFSKQASQILSLSSEQSSSMRMLQLIIGPLFLRYLIIRVCSHEYEASCTKGCADTGRS
jgi:vesicle coat complex subunit